MGVVRYVGRGAARSVLLDVSVEGRAWRRRWVRWVHLWAGIYMKEGMLVNLQGGWEKAWFETWMSCAVEMGMEIECNA